MYDRYQQDNQQHPSPRCEGRPSHNQDETNAVNKGGGRRLPGRATALFILFIAIACIPAGRQRLGESYRNNMHEVRFDIFPQYTPCTMKTYQWK